MVLNRTALEVVELCSDGTRNIGELVAALHERYPEVAVAELERDVEELLAALERRALLHFRP